MTKNPIFIEIKVQISLPPLAAYPGCFYLGLKAREAGLRAAGAFRPPDLPLQLYLHSSSPPILQPGYLGAEVNPNPSVSSLQWQEVLVTFEMHSGIPF